jgi:frataxin
MDDFYTASTQALEEINDFFESSWPQADAELLNDSLTIILPGGRQYVINKHGVTHQIWIASPFTGAHHFQKKEGKWRCTRTNTLLEDFLTSERNTHAS